MASSIKFFHAAGNWGEMFESYHCPFQELNHGHSVYTQSFHTVWFNLLLWGGFIMIVWH